MGLGLARLPRSPSSVRDGCLAAWCAWHCCRQHLCCSLPGGHRTDASSISSRRCCCWRRWADRVRGSCSNPIDEWSSPPSRGSAWFRCWPMPRSARSGRSTQPPIVSRHLPSRTHLERTPRRTYRPHYDVSAVGEDFGVEEQLTFDVVIDLWVRLETRQPRGETGLSRSHSGQPANAGG